MLPQIQVQSQTHSYVTAVSFSSWVVLVAVTMVHAVEFPLNSLFISSTLSPLLSSVFSTSLCPICSITLVAYNHRPPQFIFYANAKLK